MQWTVVIPVKALPAAKSRLAPATADPADHRRLVEAIRADTVEAARAADAVARVLVVTDAATGDDADDALVQSAPGLNAALREAAAHARAYWPDDGVAALVGDLPALRADDLSAVLAAAATVDAAYVADAPGTGTTVLTARPRHVLEPHFGPGSAVAHAAVATELEAAPGLRHDVDTGADLDAAAAHGLGRRTAAVWQMISSPRRCMMRP